MKPAEVKTTGRLWVQWLFIIIFLLYISLGLLSSADVELDKHIGLNYVTNYTPSTHPQNWCIGQDKRGVIYVANIGEGVLEYDGGSWRRIEVPNDEVRSIAVDDNGTIYIGGVNEFGFLAPDFKGTLQYKSLVNHLKDHQKNFAHVWRIHATKEGVYFRTSNYLFRWNTRQKKIDVWQAEGESYFLSIFSWNGKLLIQQKYVGLMQIVNDSLKLIPGSEMLATNKIYLIAQYDIQKLLMITREIGFNIYDYNDNTLTRFPTMLDGYLKEKELYHGIQLSNGDFALATSRGGLLVIDPQGKLKKMFTKDSGLQNDSVKYVFEDFQGNLWLALEKGISKIEYATPFSVYDEDRSNLPGLVLSVTRHGPGNDLYVGTTHGLYMLESPYSVKFRHIPINCGYCWFLLSVDDYLLVAAGNGVFQVENKMKWSRVIVEKSLVLQRSKREPNRIWVGTAGGLVSLYREDGKWTKESQFENIKEQIKTIVEDPKGNLWLEALTKDVIKVDFPAAGTIDSHIVTRYDTAYGLPPGPVRAYMAAGHVMFATAKGIYHFDERKKVFRPDHTLGAEFAGGSLNVWRVAEDKNKNIWVSSENKNFQAILQPDGTYVLNKKPFIRMPIVQVNAIYPDPVENIIWFASNDG
ncbi:MAG: hypothetical protein JSV88_14140, partial [Candidatus Aminicenantes bacterium]